MDPQCPDKKQTKSVFVPFTQKVIGSNFSNLL